jgi:hypothetical protein
MQEQEVLRQEQEVLGSVQALKQKNGNNVFPLVL